MPYITDREKLDSPFLDRRVKLLPCQKEMVVFWYKQGHSMRSLAKMFHVSRGLIALVIHPERLERILEMRHARGGSKIYYDKEMHRMSMTLHRRRKYDVLGDSVKQKRHEEPATSK